MPLFVLHGGPGLDHTMFGHHLDGLTDVCRLVFVDQRSQGRSDPASAGTWTLERMAADIEDLAQSLELDRYAVLGHSFGAFVALRHAVDFSGRPQASIISAGVPAAHFLGDVSKTWPRSSPRSCAFRSRRLGLASSRPRPRRIAGR